MEYFTLKIKINSWVVLRMTKLMAMGLIMIMNSREGSSEYGRTMSLLFPIKLLYRKYDMSIIILSSLRYEKFQKILFMN